MEVGRLHLTYALAFIILTSLLIILAKRKIKKTICYMITLKSKLIVGMDECKNIKNVLDKNYMGKVSSKTAKAEV